MADKQITYLGNTMGPYFYDDTDGDAFETDGQCKIGAAPTDPEHVVRLQDVPTAGPATTVTTEKAFGQAEAIGTSVHFAREDHTHGTPPIGWDDLRIHAESTKPGASSPTFGAWLGNLMLWWFSATLTQEAHFSVQLPHSWRKTAIYPHVHWVPKTNSDGAPANQVVRWCLDYTWAEPGKVFPAITTLVTTTHIPDEELIADKHYMSTFGSITPTTDQDGNSSMLVCRIYRTGNNAADTYEDDAGLLEIDFHYEVDSLGSLSIT